MAIATLVETFTSEHVEAFHRDGFLIVEEGLVSEHALGSSASVTCGSSTASTRPASGRTR